MRFYIICFEAFFFFYNICLLLRDVRSYGFNNIPKSLLSIRSLNNNAPQCSKKKTSTNTLLKLASDDNSNLDKKTSFVNTNDNEEANNNQKDENVSSRYSSISSSRVDSTVDDESGRDFLKTRTKISRTNDLKRGACFPSYAYGIKRKYDIQTKSKKTKKVKLYDDDDDENDNNGKDDEENEKEERGCDNNDNDKNNNNKKSLLYWMDNNIEKTETEYDGDIKLRDETTTQRIEKIFSIMTERSSPFEVNVAREIGRDRRQTRILRDRAYAMEEPFSKDNLRVPPTLEDLSPPPSKNSLDTFWISTPARLLSFFIPYVLFPYITKYLDQFVTMNPMNLEEISSKFGPAISILYATFVSLTLSILYSRQQKIQENAAIEASLLALMVRNLLTLFKYDKCYAIDAGQCAADQIRTLVKGSRGAELLGLMYSDPYARMLELIDYYEEQQDDEQQEQQRRRRTLEQSNNSDIDSADCNTVSSKKVSNRRQQNSLIGSCRDVIKDLYRLRANRLSDEALSFPPTHFFILLVLTILILLGYSVAILPTVSKETGMPSNESSLLFGFSCAIYVLFYNFAKDLNEPFGGLYQIRRSSTASHLLQAKWLIANHPLLKGEIDFEEVEVELNGNVLVRTPGLGDFWFDENEIYPDDT